MALVVGTDSYITQTDATAYVAANYLTTSAEAIAWTALSSDNKDAALRKACQTIDRLRLVGVKAVDLQTLEFPRAIRTDAPYIDRTKPGFARYTNDWAVQTEVPEAVTEAQVEEALQITIGAPKRRKLQQQGVKSFSLGNLSETYIGAAHTLISVEAKTLMRPYIAGTAMLL